MVGASGTSLQTAGERGTVNGVRGLGEEGATDGAELCVVPGGTWHGGSDGGVKIARSRPGRLSRSS